MPAASGPGARFTAYLAEIVTEHEELTLDTPVNKTILEDIESLKSQSLELEEDKIKLFVSIEKAVDDIVGSCKNCRSMIILGQKVKPKLHQFRAFTLPKLLKDVELLHPSFPTNPFIWQLVVDKSYLSLLSSVQQSVAESPTTARSLTPVEMNAIRYASGYVVRKLTKKYAKDLTPTGSKFVHCLHGMISDDSELQLAEDMDADNFEDYTSLWLRKTDRGGLYHVNDITYWLFSEVELLIYSKLKTSCSGKASERSAATIMTFTVGDGDIQFIWSLIVNNALTAEESESLLTVVVQEWMNLRGHSMCSMFVETFKQANKKDKRKGKKSLRKELKRQHTSDSEN